MKSKRLVPLFLGTIVMALTIRMALTSGLITPGEKMTRKGLLRIAGLGLTALATGGWKLRSAAAAGTTAMSTAVSCVLSPEQTQGPYYIPKEKIRSNIAEHQPGTPLKLRLNLVNASTCRPIKGAAVDIWHCNAGGIYSGFVSASNGGPGGGGPTDKHTFLRGIQRTNSHGQVQFETIYPGWYRGRTVHIHVMVHVGGTVGHIVHTGQLYFADSLTSRVYRSKPYRARATQRDTFNNTDSIYQNGGRQSTLSLKRDGHGGYLAAISLGVHH